MVHHVNGTALIYPSWGSGSYAPGHELKAVAATHILVSERPWRLCWVGLKCTTANLLTQYTAKRGVDFGWAKRAHAGPVRRWDIRISYREVHICREMTCSCPSWANGQWAKFHLTTWEHTSLVDFMVLMPFTPGPNLVQCFTIIKGSPQSQINWFRKFKFIHLYARQPSWFLGGTGRLKYHDTPNKESASEIAPCPRCQRFMGLSPIPRESPEELHSISARSLGFWTQWATFCFQFQLQGRSENRACSMLLCSGYACRYRFCSCGSYDIIGWNLPLTRTSAPPRKPGAMCSRKWDWNGP